MPRKREQFRDKRREAYRFHELAGPFLSELGFKLVDDPSLIRNPYQMTAATYKSNSGFFLCVGFDPLDSNSVSITCGRQWRASTGWFVLSNRYATVARRLDIDVPIYYSLGYGDEIPRTMERILENLKETLATVVERVTLEDLVSVESEEFGAQQKAARHLGPSYLEHVEVSHY